MLALNTLAIGAASFFAIVTANHGQISRAHHHNPLLERSGAHLQKRFSGTATFYDVGLGACGITNSRNDPIVALNSAQYGGGYPGPHCFKWLKICMGDNCQSAQVTDECPTCDFGSLDLSRGLFSRFATEDAGVFQMTWSWADGGEPETTKKPDPPKTTEKPDPPKTTKKPDPPKTTKEPEPEPETTTSSKKPKPTTTTQPETTSTPEPTTTTSSTSTSSVLATTSTSEASITTTASTVSASASPSGVSGSGSGSGSSGSNWADLAQVMLGMGALANQAHSN